MNIKVSTEAQKLLEEVANKQTLSNGLHLLGRIVNMTVMEVETVSSYNEATGKPQDYTLKPYKWDGRIWFNWNTPTLPLNSPFGVALKNGLPEGEVAVIQIEGEQIVVYHVPPHNCGDGTTPEHIHIKKAVKF